MIKDEAGNRRFYGVYRGVITDVLDPLGKGRVRLKVPQVLLEEETGWAWAIHQSDAVRRVPPVGTGVWVQFEAGDPSYPVWLGTFEPLPFNYGSFYDNTNQTAASTAVAYAIKLGTTDQASNVRIVDGSKITITYPGTYNLQWSGQFANTDSQAHDVRIWLNYNGVEYPNSSSVITVPSKHGSVNGHLIAAWNWVGTSQTTDDYVQIMWSTENTAISLETSAAGTSPVSPVVPSVIVTLTQVK